MKHLIAICLTLGMIGIFATGDLLAGAKEREDRPVEIQLNAVGGFSLGYHINSVIYIGVLQSNAMTPTESTDADNSFNDDYSGGTKTSEHKGMSQGAEIRFYPFNFGLFIGAGTMKLNKEWDYRTYDERRRLLGDNAYSIGFDVTMDYPEYEGSMVGLGYNGSFANGFTLTGLFYVGTGAREDPTVVVSNYTGPILASDQLAVEDHFQKQAEQRPAGMLLIGLGYAF